MSVQSPIESVDAELITASPPVWNRRPVLRQQWTELGYFHWPYDPTTVQRLLPRGLSVDVHDGSAWIGLIPFEMRNVQLGSTPSLPWLGSFIEINVRTYVVDRHGRRAVWFFSLDVPRSGIVAVARTAFALPYCWASASHVRDGDRHRYEMARRWPRSEGASASIDFTVGEALAEAEVSDLDHFLTARWALITRRRDHLSYGRVHHRALPLHRVQDVHIDQQIIEAAGLPSPSGPPLARYSPGVDVQVGWFENLQQR